MLISWYQTLIKFYQQNIFFTFSLNLFPRSNSFLNRPKEAAPGDRITTSPFSAFSFNKSKRESKLLKGPLYLIAFSSRRGIKRSVPVPARRYRLLARFAFSASGIKFKFLFVPPQIKMGGLSKASKAAADASGIVAAVSL